MNARLSLIPTATLRALERHPCGLTVPELATAAGVTQAVAERHTRALRRAGLALCIIDEARADLLVVAVSVVL